jgi:serine protease Do
MSLMACNGKISLPSEWNQSSKAQGDQNTPGQDDKASSLQEALSRPPAKKDPNQKVLWKGSNLGADTFIEISKKADLGVVNIGTTKVMKPRANPFGQGPRGGSPFDQFFGEDMFKFFFGQPQAPQQERKQTSLGSGFIISKDGLIVTNNHVIDQADEITVTIGHDREYQAKLIGSDPKTDVALIKIEPEEELYPLSLGDSQSLQVGEIVVAIGNPFGLSHTVTQGIVSAKARTIGFGPYDNFIQTDASINPGNSGGPLLNLQAEVVGINTAIHATGQGIGFAIPINLAKNILSQLEETGSVTRGWLGVYIQPVEKEVADALGLDKAQGALVARVQKNSPAEAAGIQAGDVILNVDGKQIKDANALPRFVANLKAGQEVKIVLMRKKKLKTIELTIGTLPDEEQPEAQQETIKKGSKPDKLGLYTSEITDQDRQRLDLPEGQKGVVVNGMTRDFPAYGQGLKPGNVITEVNYKAITNLKSYENILDDLKDGDTVSLKVLQDNRSELFLVFPLSGQ